MMKLSLLACLFLILYVNISIATNVDVKVNVNGHHNHEESMLEEGSDESPNVSAGSTGGVSKGVDFGWGSSNYVTQARNFKTAGISFVGRYISPQGAKNIKAAEAKAYHDQGMKVLLAAEGTGQEVKSGFNGGVNQARAALRLANSLGIPNTAVFYFAVDFDLQASQLRLLDAYLKGAASVVGLQRTGVYGSYRVANYAITHNLVADLGACKAVWQCFAWSYGKWQTGVAVRQTANERRVGGISVDLNTGFCPNIGAW